MIDYDSCDVIKHRFQSFSFFYQTNSEKLLKKYFIFLKVWKNQIVFKNGESYRGILKQRSCATGLSKMFSFWTV